MAPPEQAKTPFAQSVWDTSALIFFGSTIFFPVILFPLGALMIWLSKRWTRGEKLGATLSPLIFMGVGALFVGSFDRAASLMLFAFIVPMIAAFFLAFRMGTRSPKYAGPEPTTD
ncbi:MAG: hypothetical protein ACRDKE_09040 [Solirubrobacterales bacterium]